MIGSTIAHYSILEKLGEGGMSENCLRVVSASSSNFQDPCLRAGHAGRQAPLFGGGVI